MSVDLIARALGARSGPTANTAALIAALRSNGAATRPLERLPASDQPVLTQGGAGANSTINARAYWNPLFLCENPVFTYLSGPIVKAGTTSPSWGYARSRGAAYGGGGRGSGPFAYEFMHSGTQLEIPVFGMGNPGTNFRVLVNGCIAGTMALPYNTGQGCYVKLVFPVSGTRRITVETQSVPANGVNVANAAEIASTGAARPLVTVIGDSFAEGTGAALGEGEVLVMARALGFDCSLAASGGTGMLNPGTRVNFLDPERLLDMTLSGITSVQTGAAAADPKLAVVLGTMNDHLSSPGAFGATLQEAIANRTHAMIDAWQAARPGKPIVFFGPTWPSGPPNNRPPLTVYNVRDGIMEAAWSRANENVWYIDRLMPHLREGVWNTASDQASLYTTTDGTHPTALGHKLDGLWMATVLRRLILSEFA